MIGQNLGHNASLSEKGGAYWNNNMPAILANVKKILGFEILGRYKKDDVLIIMGEKSAIYEFEVFEKIFPALKRENVKIIKGAGHWVHADKPMETLDEILKFLKNIDNKP